VNGKEKAGLEAARDRRSLLKRKVTILFSRQRDPHPAALFQEVRKIFRHGKGQVFFGSSAGDPGSAGILAAMSRVDQDDRAPRQSRLANPNVGHRSGKVERQFALPRFADKRDAGRIAVGSPRRNGQDDGADRDQDTCPDG